MNRIQAPIFTTADLESRIANQAVRIRPGFKMSEVFAQMPHLLRINQEEEPETFTAQTELSYPSVVFTLPCPFSVICSGIHFPSIVRTAEQFKNKLGLDVYCAVLGNRYDARLLQSTPRSLRLIKMIPDYLGNFASLAGMLTLNPDDDKDQLGLRFPRAAFIVLNGIVRDIQEDINPNVCHLTQGEAIFLRTANYFELINQKNREVTQLQTLFTEFRNLQETIYGQKLDEVEFYTSIDPDHIHTVDMKIEEMSRRIAALKRDEQQYQADLTQYMEIAQQNSKSSSAKFSRIFHEQSSLKAKRDFVLLVANIPILGALDIYI